MSSSNSLGGFGNDISQRIMSLNDVTERANPMDSHPTEEVEVGRLIPVLEARDAC